MMDDCQGAEGYMMSSSVVFSMMFAPPSWNPKKVTLALLKVWAILLIIYTFSLFFVCDTLLSLSFLQTKLEVGLISVLFMTTVKSLTKYFFPEYYKTHMKFFDHDP